MGRLIISFGPDYFFQFYTSPRAISLDLWFIHLWFWKVLPRNIPPIARIEGEMLNSCYDGHPRVFYRCERCPVCSSY